MPHWWCFLSGNKASKTRFLPTKKDPRRWTTKEYLIPMNASSQPRDPKSILLSFPFLLGVSFPLSPAWTYFFPFLYLHSILIYLTLPSPTLESLSLTPSFILSSPLEPTLRCGVHSQQELTSCWALSSDQDHRETPPGVKDRPRSCSSTGGRKSNCQGSFREESNRFSAKHSMAEAFLILHLAPHKKKAYCSCEIW